jgi:hypothetical protein
MKERKTLRAKMLTSHDHAQKELDHIKTIISHLEYQWAGHEFAPTSAVAQVNYWRTRICAVLALPDTPSRIAEQGVALLARLDRIHTAPRNGAGHDRG